jgi:catechol 2,3-dioxygenase-like lactoylglutathione lyase family enzyme
VPAVRRVLETSLYCDDPVAVARFYRDVLDLDLLIESERLIALDAGEATVLLIFKRGSSAEGVTGDVGRLPPHDGSGPVHLAFAIDAEEVAGWERRLAEKGITVESRLRWPRGGTSLYFRDPEGHSVELATPGLWKTY